MRKSACSVLRVSIVMPVAASPATDIICYNNVGYKLLAIYIYYCPRFDK